MKPNTTFILFLLAVSTLARAASPPSVYTHLYLMPIGKASSGEPTEPEEAVASVHVIRPLATLAGGHRLAHAEWKENRDEASRLRAVFRAEAEAQYRKWNVLEGELSPSIKEDLDTLVDGRSAIIAISEPGHPEKLLQLISAAYDGAGGLPLERRLRNVFPGIERNAHQFGASTVRFVEQFGSLLEFPKVTRIMSGQPALQGEPVEIKTFIKGHESQGDWVPYILHLVLSMDLARYGATPLSREELRLAREWSTAQTTVRIDDIWIEVIGERLLRLYKSRYGFEDTGLAFPDPDVAGETVHLMRSSRVDFENFMVDRLQSRQGYKLVLDFGHVPTDIENIITSRGEGACLVGFSQLGRATVPPILGTRGAILPMTLGD